VFRGRWRGTLPEVIASPFALLDARGRVRFVSADTDADGDLAALMEGTEKLRPEIAQCARDAAERRAVTELRGVPLTDGRLVRIAPLFGDGATMLLLSIEDDQSGTRLASAIRRFHLTRRETAVLTELLAGSQTREIGPALGISGHTVDGYVKRLLSKTGSRNRSAMLAKILNWSAAGAAQRASNMLSGRESGG